MEATKRTRRTTIDIQKENEAALTLERARELLAYDPETGDVAWRVSGPGRTKGAKAGWRRFNCKVDWLRVKIDCRYYNLARVIWFMQTGRWPAQDLHARDLDGGNLRWSNLCEATPAEARAHVEPQPNKHGFRNVMRHSRTKRYCARVRYEGRDHIGPQRETAEEAYSDVCAIRSRLLGDFVREAA